jgi:hypothetical protein
MPVVGLGLIRNTVAGKIQKHKKVGQFGKFKFTNLMAKDARELAFRVISAQSKLIGVAQRCMSDFHTHFSGSWWCDFDCLQRQRLG